MLVDHDLKLALKLSLLLRVRSPAGRQGGHVLDDQKSKPIGSLVEQVRLDLDLHPEVPVSILHHSIIGQILHSHACEPC